jgi:chromosome segregation ATPase
MSRIETLTRSSTVVTNLPSVRNAIETRLRGPRDHAKRIKKEVEELVAEIDGDTMRKLMLETRCESLRQMHAKSGAQIREDRATLQASKEKLRSLREELEHRPAEYEEAKTHRDQRSQQKQGEVNGSQSHPFPWSHSSCDQPFRLLTIVHD